MAYNTILVPLDGGPAGAALLDTAHQVAAAQAAHLDVFHAHPDSKEAVPLLGEGMSGAMIEEMMELADRDASSRSHVALQLYESFRDERNLPVVEQGPADSGASISWSVETGREDELVARHGRLADLIVMGHPESDAERPSLMTLHAAIFETGKPVLIAPPEKPSSIGKRVTIAWNGSTEAARAVAGAMPFLTSADSVVVTSIETEKSASRLGTTELVRYLAWHGVKCDEQTVSPAGHAVGDALLLQCEKDSSDLLVMGAYTHSRVIQIILGGVTRHIITEARLPVLMSH